MKTSLAAVACIFLLVAARAQEGTIDQMMAEAVDLHEVNDGNRNFEGFEKLKALLDRVEIVALGEQTHFDGTTAATKVKLLQYLHGEMGFDMLVFESGFYDCRKAWQQISEGEEAGMALGKVLPNAWALTLQSGPMLAYIDSAASTDRPLEIMGMDYQLSFHTAKHHYLEDLEKKLGESEAFLPEGELWLHLITTVELLLAYNRKELEKRDTQRDKAYIDTLIGGLGDGDDDAFWKQVLENLKLYIDDLSLDEDTRDEAMARNLMWIKDRYPDKKIICWGATRHFLYNSQETRIKNPLIRLLMGNFFETNLCMGNYVKEKYGDAFYTIGFSTYGGTYGFGGVTTLKDARKKSLEYAVAQRDFDNCLIPLGPGADGFISRPLGHKYMTNNISRVMDALIFNREMEPLYIDSTLHKRIDPGFYAEKDQ